MTVIVITTLLVLSSFALGFMFGVNNPDCVQKVRDFIAFWRKK
jgi:hypothetical protein